MGFRKPFKNDWLVNSGIQEEVSFYLLDSFVIIAGTAFIFPVSVLLILHCGNSCAGKTTMERFGKAGGARGNDLEAIQSKIVNSGIKNDNRIYSSLAGPEY